MYNQLPILDLLPRLLSCLKTGNQIILKAATGAGKSTALPLQLIKRSDSEIGFSGQILLLEPRRIAVRSIAHFIATSLGEKVGKSVGYRMRGENKETKNTRLVVITEGILTRMLQSDPELVGVDLIIFDEFHERNLHSDVGLAFSLEVQATLREDLKLLVMSATLDYEDLHTIMPEASFIESQGRSYPISYVYDPVSVHQSSFYRDKLQSISQKIIYWLEKESGSALVFLSGQKEIRILSRCLKARLADDVQLYCLYGRQTLAEQERAIAPATRGYRKLVLTTNVAETSLTIEGIRLVFDLGLERVDTWDPKSRITKLETKQIAKSSAIQRAGRAGRTQEGVCIRFYSKEVFEHMQSFAEPDILRSDLTDLAFELVQWGAFDVTDLAWLDTPNPAYLQSAFVLLQTLDIINAQHQLTQTGKAVAKLALSPRWGIMVHMAQVFDSASCEQDWMKLACLLVAIMEQHISHTNADLTLILESIVSKRHTTSSFILKRTASLLSALGVKDTLIGIDEKKIGVLLSIAYPDRVGLLRKDLAGQGSVFSLSNGQLATLSEYTSLALSDFIVAVDLSQMPHGEQAIFLAATVDMDLYAKMMPQRFVWQNKAYWNETLGRIISEKRYMCGQLVLTSVPDKAPSDEVIMQGLLCAIQQKGLSVLPWNEKARSLWLRYQWLSASFDEFKSAHPINDAYLLAHVQQWLSPFLTGIKSIKALQKINLYNALEAWIGWDKVKKINQLAPTHYVVPTGSLIKLRYRKEEAPILSVRIQEMYGQEKTPMIAQGRCALVVELLSPAHRSLQVTQDLASFWQSSYKEVQKEMKGRYPKHIWPDDPAHHQATKKIKKYFK